jgi:hypothetical protein
MATLSTKQLTSKLIDFVSQRGSCLFAGAGVGKRAGLPSWEEYLDHLSAVAARYDKDLAALMRKRLTAGFYLQAAELYKSAIEIPQGLKYQELASPFANAATYSPSKLHGLIALPFSAVVTTNYDRSLHDAYYNLYDKQTESGLSLQAPKYVELGDLSMKQAVFWTDFYIARIHGRAEIPETMVVDRNDYIRTESDPYYQDFLLNVLKKYRCLFLGYSFVDPAINRVLDLMSKTLVQPHPRLHLALVPDDCAKSLAYELAKFNVEVVEYDPDSNHESLWKSIRAAQREVRSSPRRAPDKVESVAGITRFVASCYSRLKLGDKAEPLREMVIEGIVAQTIMDAGPNGTTEGNLPQILKKYISMTDDQLGNLIKFSVNRLVSKGVCNREEGVLKCQQADRKAFDTALETLVEATVNRMKVREGVEADSVLRRSISDILNRLLLTRGWDLGAHFAGGSASSTFEAWPQIQGVIENLVKNISPSKYKALANAIYDLFRHPEDKEAELLADMGRIAFAVELVLNNSRTTVQLFLVPETLYLDANVLMPAIVEGHPYSPVYADAISRMIMSAKGDGSTTRILTAKDFLNEIIHHRHLAIQEVKDQGLEDIDRLRHKVLIYSSENTNVYIGAYASFIGRTGDIVSFEEFLRKAAPYDSETSLREYLGQRGVEVISISFLAGQETVLYNKVRAALHQAYEDLGESLRFYIPKVPVLIDHEAAQLTRLMLDIQNGRKSIFVTADKRLMGLCHGEVLGRCGNAILSQLGFVQLVDLILGIETDKRSLGRLFWSVELSDEETTIRNYLIDLALRHYDEVQAMAMWEVIDEIAEEAAKTAKSEGINIFVGKEEDKSRTAKFLDRFEQDFFKKMADLIRTREEYGRIS